MQCITNRGAHTNRALQTSHEAHWATTDHPPPDETRTEPHPLMHPRTTFKAFQKNRRLHWHGVYPTDTVTAQFAKHGRLLKQPTALPTLHPRGKRITSIRKLRGSTLSWEHPRQALRGSPTLYSRSGPNMPAVPNERGGRKSRSLPPVVYSRVTDSNSSEEPVSRHVSLAPTQKQVRSLLTHLFDLGPVQPAPIAPVDHQLVREAQPVINWYQLVFRRRSSDETCPSLHDTPLVPCPPSPPSACLDRSCAIPSGRGTRFGLQG